MVIDDKTKQSRQEDLFDFIATSVSNFIKEQKISAKLPLGFTFSFPVQQSSLISGKLIRWTKDFSASGAEGEDVVRLLGEAFARRGVSLHNYYCESSMEKLHFYSVEGSVLYRGNVQLFCP